MIISFLGCPRSGKTTTAARLFSNLKEHGFKCEYVPEQARFYIAERRVELKLTPTDTLVLQDTDQFQIMCRQIKMERTILQACGEDTIVISDCSPLLALLYMSEKYRAMPFIQDNIELIQKNKDVHYFYAAPVPWLGGIDPNRIHTKEESLAIDKEIGKIVIPLLSKEPTYLVGEPDSRWRIATSSILQAIMET